jgi:tRNA nucleotidyltransferase (CCA-adding enzyme)
MSKDLPAQLELLQSIQSVTARLQARGYAVGGVLRELLRGASLVDQDIDVTVEGDAPLVARTFSEAHPGSSCLVHHRFLTAKVTLSECWLKRGIAEVDFAQTRKETYESPGALPTVFSARLVEDLGRRDFTVNALAIEIGELIAWIKGSGSLEQLGAKVIDQFGGLRDLKEGQIKILHDRSFIDDPTRLFRACRYAARLNGEIAPLTKDLALGAVKSGALATISQFRILQELKSIFREQSFLSAWRLLLEIGGRSIFPGWEEREIEAIDRAFSLLSQQRFVSVDEREFVALAVIRGVGALYDKGIFANGIISRKDSRALDEAFDGADVGIETPTRVLLTRWLKEVAYDRSGEFFFAEINRRLGGRS